MKGFGIEIKNTLLDPKHIDAMGPAVWFYMFLLDKLTSIDEAGVGKVLGGRPIKYEEVKKELGISQDTYSRWIARLVQFKYIESTRTPYGVSFRVFKAYKRFGNRIRKNAESGQPVDKASDSAEVQEGVRKNAESNSEVVRNPIRQNSKTIQNITNIYPSWLDKEAWSDWVKYRKEKKKALTETSIKQQIKFLSQHIDDHSEIILTSIRNSWTGLFPLAGKNKLPAARKDDYARAHEKRLRDDEERREFEENAKHNDRLREVGAGIESLRKSMTKNI